MSESDSRPEPAAADGVAILLARAGKHALRAVDAQLAPFRISVTEYLALLHVARHEHPSAGALARYVDLDSGAMTRLLDRMEEMGLLQRRLDPADRRVVRLFITEPGRRRLVDLDGAIVRVHEALARTHTGADLGRFMAYLQTAIGDVAALKEKS